VAFRRTAHALYDTQYPLVWAPEYRERILRGQIKERMDALLREIAQAYRITIDEMQVTIDQVHILCSFAPNLSITQALTRLKGLPARAILREYPQIKRPLWGGEFWEEGYFVRTLGDDVGVRQRFLHFRAIRLHSQDQRS
jgi:putative transposase